MKKYASTKKYLSKLCDEVFSPAKYGSDNTLVSLPGQGHMSLIESLIYTRTIPFSPTKILKEFWGEEFSKVIFVPINLDKYKKDSLDDFYLDAIQVIKSNPKFNARNLISAFDKYSFQKNIFQVLKEGYKLIIISRTLKSLSEIEPSLIEFLFDLQNFYTDQFKFIWSFMRLDDEMKNSRYKRKFLKNVTYIKPLPKEEVAYQMKKFFSELNLDTPSEKEIDDVYKLSGGLGAIMKDLFREVAKNGSSKKLSYPESSVVHIEEILSLLTKEDFLEIKKREFSKDSYPYLTGLSDRTYLLESIMNLKKKQKKTITLNDIELALTKIEFEIFKLLNNNSNRIISKEEIANIIWEQEATNKYSDWAIDKHISNLRKKLPQNITLTSKKKVGYTITHPV